MILDVIVEDKKRRLAEHKQNISEREMMQKAQADTRIPRSFYEALAKPGLSIIGEFKKASPSLGVIDNPLPLKERIDHYNSSVDAISCLTEEDHFYGNADYLKEIRGLSMLPILRKDFVIDEYQIYEAKVIGADAVLLIAAILDDARLNAFYELTMSLGMEALVEVHDERELERAAALHARIIGVNNRNLRDFSISLETTARLSEKRPEGCLFVSESGVTEDQHIKFLKTYGVDALLIGRAFMESDNPEALAARWKARYLEV